MKPMKEKGYALRFPNERVYQAFKARCLLLNRSMNMHIIDLIKKDLARDPSNYLKNVHDKH